MPGRLLVFVMKNSIAGSEPLDPGFDAQFIPCSILLYKIQRDQDNMGGTLSDFSDCLAEIARWRLWRVVRALNLLPSWMGTQCEN